MKRLAPAVLSLAFSAMVAAFSALVASPAHAQSDIFLCVDDNGQKVFQNVGTGKGCKRVDVGPVLTLPASRQNGARSTGSEDRASAAPANFPRIDRETQRNRDSDRKRILEDELKAEEDKLGRLKIEFNNGEPERRGDERNFALYQDRTKRLREDVARVEANVNALRREISLLRTQ